MYKLKSLFIRSPKSTKLVNYFRHKGDEFLEKKQYFEALISYNKSLCHAESGSVEMSKIFARRSAVYFEMELYEKCLENIQVAEENSRYEIDENKRYRIMRLSERKKSDTVVPSFFKLSRPPHPQVPYIVNCLQLSENKKFGRFIVTNRDLKPGEVIAIEEPFMSFIDNRALSHFKYQRCFNCLKSNHLNLLPGPQSGNWN